MGAQLCLNCLHTFSFSDSFNASGCCFTRWFIQPLPFTPFPARMPFHIASIRSETNTSLPMAHVVALNFLVPSHSPHIFVSFFWRKNKHGKSIRIASRQKKMKQEREKKTRKVCSSDFFVLLSHFLRYYFQLGWEAGARGTFVVLSLALHHIRWERIIFRMHCWLLGFVSNIKKARVW